MNERFNEQHFNQVRAQNNWQKYGNNYATGFNPYGKTKAMSNYNSVRVNSAWKKFVSLELHSETQIAIRFIKFYSDNLKAALQRIKNCRFDTDFRCWLIDIESYE